MGDAREQRRLSRRERGAMKRTIRLAGPRPGFAPKDGQAQGRGKGSAGPLRIRRTTARASKSPMPVRPVAEPDQEAMARAIADFLRAARVPMSRADASRTPDRVAEAWANDLISGYAQDPVAELTSEPAPIGEGMVVLRDIEFHSTCVHHLLPFFGRAHIAYLPDRRLVGLSKIARALEILSRRLQVQERLTEQIVGILLQALRPLGVACVLEAEHLCIACRGVRKTGVRILTSRFAGRLARGGARVEVLKLLGH